MALWTDFSSLLLTTYLLGREVRKIKTKIRGGGGAVLSSGSICLVCPWAAGRCFILTVGKRQPCLAFSLSSRAYERKSIIWKANLPPHSSERWWEDKCQLIRNEQLRCHPKVPAKRSEGEFQGSEQLVGGRPFSKPSITLLFP